MATRSPVTDDIDEMDESSVYELLMFRVTATDEEWAEDPLSAEIDLTREEAATRLDQTDYSPFS